MQLPQSLQKFSHPTLIVLTDHVHAQLWLAHELELNQIDQFEILRERMSDAEEFEVDADPDRLNHFIKELATRISQHASKQNAKHLYLAMKPELMHLLEKELQANIHSLINRREPHDLMKEDMLNVVKRLLTSKTP